MLLFWVFCYMQLKLILTDRGRSPEESLCLFSWGILIQIYIGSMENYISIYN